MMNEDRGGLIIGTRAGGLVEGFGGNRQAAPSEMGLSGLQSTGSFLASSVYGEHDPELGMSDFGVCDSA